MSDNEHCELGRVSSCKQTGRITAIEATSQKTMQAIEAMQTDIRRVLTAIAGDEQLGTDGLVQKHAKNETQISALQYDVGCLKSDRRWVSGIVVGITSAINIIWIGLVHFFKKGGA